MSMLYSHNVVAGRNIINPLTAGVAYIRVVIFLLAH